MDITGNQLDQEMIARLVSAQPVYWVDNVTHTLLRCSIVGVRYSHENGKCYYLVAIPGQGLERMSPAQLIMSDKELV